MDGRDTTASETLGDGGEGDGAGDVSCLSTIEDWVGWCLSACSAGENNVVSQSWVLGQNIDYPPLDITCDFENAI